MKKSLIALIVLIVIAGGVVYRIKPTNQTDEITTVRIGLIPWPGYDFLHLAKDKGFFDEEGVDVELVEQTAAINQFSALENGQISAVAITLNELIDNNVHWSTPVTAVAIMDYSYGGDVILGQKDIKTVQDLRGKKVAVEDSTLGVYMLGRALEIAGMTIDDVEVVSMGLAFGVQAMQNHNVDGFVCFPPYSTDLAKTLPVNTIFDTTKIPEEIVDVLAFTTEFVDSHPEVIKKVIRGWEKALLYSKENPQDAYVIMARHEGMSVAEFEDAMSGINIPNLQEQKEIFKRKSLQKTAARIMDIVLSEEQKSNAPPVNSFTHKDILFSMD